MDIFCPFCRKGLIVLTSFVLVTACADDGAVLFDGGKPLQMIFQGVEKAESNDMTVALGGLIVKMTGTTPETTTVPSVGEITSRALVLRIVEDEANTQDSFSIRTESGGVVVTSASALGLRLGFYALMEKLGCKYWAWDAEDIPRLTEVKVGPLNETWKPPFQIHDLMNREATTTKNDFVYKIRARSPVQFTGGHTIQRMLRPFAEAHPAEVYPLVKTRDTVTKTVTGEVRGFNDLHYCYTSPGIAEALAEALEKEVTERKGDLKSFIYFAGMGDWYGGMCECPRCQKVYDEETWTNADGTKLPGYSATLLMMVNKAAEILDVKYPGIQIGTFAYMSLEAPPARTAPRSNVSIWIPRLRHSGNTAANDPKGDNREFWLNAERWCELAKNRVYVWDYGANFFNFLFPYPALDTISENIKAYHSIGVRGLMIQGNYVSMGGDSIAITNYVWSHLMSNPEMNSAKLSQEFIDGYYGPAAPEVKAYMRELEASFRYPSAETVNEFSNPAATYLTPKVMDGLKVRMDAARALVAKPEQAEYLARVNDLGMGVDAAKLWSDGPLAEMKGKYVRIDFRRDTSGEAMELFRANRRGASPMEFSSGRSKWIEFLSWHGGPVQTFRAGDMTVKIFPTKAGTIGPVKIDSRPALVKTYDQGLVLAAFEESADPLVAKYSGETGIDSWSPETKHIFRGEIQLMEGYSFRVDYLDQRVSKAPEMSSAFHSICTVYPIKPSATDAKIAYRDTSGSWHDLKEIPAPGVEIKLANVTGWRVTTPQSLVTDEYVMKAGAGTKPPLDPARPHLSAIVSTGSDGNIMTRSNFQPEDISFDQPMPTISRLVKIEKL